jgi:membrane protein implicated in regulation of membrane protease activity
MAIHYWWWLLALGLGILELITGTFYLLVFACGSVGAGIAAAFGAPLWGQCLVAAAISLAGAAWVRRSRTGAASSMLAGRNADVLADIGERVQVDAWDAHGLARIQYRGTQWTARIAQGQAPEPGEFIIREVVGNQLVLSRH